MNWVVARMKWIMLVTGLLTCTMIYTALAPQAALRSTFGVSLEGAVAEIVVRSWGILITLIGVMLIHGAFRVHVRPLVLVVAGLSKLTFIGLVLTYGVQYLGHQVGVVVVVDLIMVALFAVYLIAAPRQRAATPTRDKVIP